MRNVNDVCLGPFNPSILLQLNSLSYIWAMLLFFDATVMNVIRLYSPIKKRNRIDLSEAIEIVAFGLRLLRKSMKCVYVSVFGLFLSPIIGHWISLMISLSFASVEKLRPSFMASDLAIIQ